MWSFNYGEWTEAYVFLWLLGHGRIYGANSDFVRDESVYMDIVNILRHEKDNHILRFDRIIENNSVRAFDNYEAFDEKQCSELKDKAVFLYNVMRMVHDSKRRFSVPEIEEYLVNLHFSQPKVPKLPEEVAEQYGKKADILITTIDSIDHAVSTTGFSIKSHVGGESSLFNCALTSNFIYEIVGCTESDMNELNGKKIDSPIDMIQYIKNNPNLSLDYIGTSEDFKDNLDFIELRMTDIINNLLLIQIGYYERAKSNNTKDLVVKLAEMNPLGVKRSQEWYKAKITSLLFASFSGLTAQEPWDGRHRLSGGYIDVSKEGELLYFRAVSDDVFGSYLYEHTYFDRPDRGVNKDIAKVTANAHLEGREPTEEELDKVKYKLNEDGSFKLDKNGKRIKQPKKGDWGYVIREGSKYFINLNFQIRFR